MANAIKLAQKQNEKKRAKNRNKIKQGKNEVPRESNGRRRWEQSERREIDIKTDGFRE